ncbi:MAG: GNAT family N-acetyltransferase [Prevotella sp.]|nr:GNAT family N-acetyltransferase [Prevotella sp.]
MFEIRPYTEDKEQEWNEFVENSKNGTFLFNRNYMDYHRDRFNDYSLMFYLKGSLHAVLPANKQGDTLYSHQGLTYGGLILNSKAKAGTTLTLFQEMNEYLKTRDFKHIIYKPTPWIYHSIPAEEDLYALTNICHARIIAREISSTIFLKNKIRFSELRRRCVNKAHKNGIEIRQSDDYTTFWNILNNNLYSKYNVHPVHSLDEIYLLAHRFPREIKLYMAYKDDKTMGGSVVFVMKNVVHTQYISASEEGKRIGALDALFDYLINSDIFADKEYFDFGKSTEQNGQLLNNSLIFQKEGFGGRGVCYDHYMWDL